MNYTSEKLQRSLKVLIKSDEMVIWKIRDFLIKIFTKLNQ